MTLGEFSVIERFFSRPVASGILGVGDDAARLSLPPDTDLVSSKDLLIEGRHFFADVSPAALGHKALAVNLSDLAAMGAKPLACLLGIGLPSVKPDWLSAFADGFYQLSDRWQCPLIGGDTVSSDQGIVISVTALGTLPKGQPGLRRDRAQTGDDLWVSGDLGAADVALRALQGDHAISPQVLAGTRDRLERPDPRVSLGSALLPYAHAAIDISDGLTQDLQHLLTASRCGAEIDWQRLPIHPAIQTLPDPTIRSAVLHGGDVYELCFTAPAKARRAIESLASEVSVPLHRVGILTEALGLRLRQVDGSVVSLTAKGFDHFKRSEQHG
jgi:thiamine-monophosphate kinase